MFEPGKNLYGLMAAISRKVDGSALEGAFHKLEHLSKVPSSIATTAGIAP